MLFHKQQQTASHKSETNQKSHHLRKNYWENLVRPRILSYMNSTQGTSL